MMIYNISTSTYEYRYVFMHVCMYVYMVQVSIKTFKKEQFIPLMPVAAMEIIVLNELKVSYQVMQSEYLYKSIEISI